VCCVLVVSCVWFVVLVGMGMVVAMCVVLSVCVALVVVFSLLCLIVLRCGFRWCGFVFCCLPLVEMSGTCIGGVYVSRVGHGIVFLEDGFCSGYLDMVVRVVCSCVCIVCFLCDVGWFVWCWGWPRTVCWVK